MCHNYLFHVSLLRLFFFGELSGLLPSLEKGGGSGSPQGDSRLTEFLSVGVTLCLPPGSQD